MKKFFFLAFSLVVVCVSGQADVVSAGGSNCDDPDPDKCGSRRRRLQTSVHGPCTRFPYANDDNPTCPITPDVNPNVKVPNGLSIFARDWIDYTCCNIVSKKMREIIPSVWLWLQVCTNAMKFAKEESYTMDKSFGKTNVTSYAGGPLHNMRRYCPTDLDGGKLTEWVVATFFPVMEQYNKWFKEFDHSVDTCKIDKEKTGAATFLLTTPKNNGTFGHIAMIVHEDITKPPFTLPQDDDKKHYVSFTNLRHTVGVMITGTKAHHVGFGRDLEKVDETLTIYNVDAENMLKEWDRTKTSNQMFDLMNWNCARTVLEVLQAGYPDCDMHLKQLWTPERAFGYIKDVKKATHPKVHTARRPYDVTVKTIRARQIPPEVRTLTRIEERDIPWALIIGIGLGTFFLNLLLVVVVLGIMIWRIKADAEKKLERGLANLLISSRGPRGTYEKAAVAPTRSRDAAVKTPSNLSFPPEVPDDLPLESPRFSDAIIAELDGGNKDGMIDFDEFSAWAKKNELDEAQRKLMWKELDKNNDGQVSKDEWNLFIQKRPRLKWLVTRLRSLHYH